MSRLNVYGDIKKVADGVVTNEDLFHLEPNDFAIGGGAVGADQNQALHCICDSTFLFKHVYVCKLNELDQVKIHGSDLEKEEKGFYTPLMACYGYSTPRDTGTYNVTTSQAQFIESILWKKYPDAVTLSFIASAKIRRNTFAGSIINGSVARDRSPQEKQNDFNTDPLMHLPDFKEGYMWVTGVSVDTDKITGRPQLEHIDRAFYYLHGAEPKGNYKHHCHGIITDSLPQEWLDENILDWKILNDSARTFLAPRRPLDDFPVHLSDSCEMDIIKAAVWVHGEGEIEYQG